MNKMKKVPADANVLDVQKSVTTDKAGLPEYVRVFESDTSHFIHIGDLSPESVEDIIVSWGAAFREKCLNARIVI